MGRSSMLSILTFAELLTDIAAPLSPGELHRYIMERLSESTIEDNHACLLDSCVEAASRFE